jgi:tripartite-type tricarboxylate transporter receptor subunit TctC
MRSKESCRAAQRTFVALAAAGVFAILPCALPSQAIAQSPSEWPAKPVRIITPFPSGAGPEVIARVLAEKLSRLWGSQVIVENRPGGNGFVAITAFKQGDKNGYDLIQLDNVHLTAYPHLFKKLPYDPRADFELLVPLFKASFFFVVATNSSYKGVADIIADAKAKPGKLNYGSWSIGNPVHLASELFGSLTGTQMQHVVYKETSQLYSDVANGELAFALGTYGTTQALYKAGRLRYVAVIGAKRLPAYPDVPTVRESGGPAELEALGWTTLAAPRGVPPAVAEKIRRDLEKVLAEPDIAQRYATFGYESFPVTKEQFNAHIVSESARFAEVIRKAKISVD